MRDIQYLAEKIGLNKSYLTVLSKNHNKCYQSYYLRQKSTKVRMIDAPNSELKGVQRWILRNVLENQPISLRAHAFTKGRSIKTHAKYHLHNRVIMCLDIKDFFPSIKKDNILPIFEHIFENKKVAEVLSNLCTFEEHLPQGAPTSPTLSNIVFKATDNKISEISNQSGVNYTRYADDLTFSSNDFARLHNLKPRIEKILRKDGFRINKKKTRLLTGKNRMLVTGLLLNSGKLTAGRARKRQIRAGLHNYVFKRDQKVNLKKLLGTLAFIRDIEPDFYDKFIKYRSGLGRKRQLYDSRNKDIKNRSGNASS